MEGADLQQEFGQLSEIVHDLESPDHEFQQQAGDTRQRSRHGVKAAVQRRGFDFLIGFIEFLIDFPGGIRLGQMELDHGFLTVGAHILFHRHGELDVIVALVDPLSRQETVDAGIFGDAAHIGSQEHMGNAEILHALGTLFVNVTFDIGDLQLVMDGVGGTVAVGHDVVGDKRHTVDGTKLPSVAAVAPGGMVFSVGENAQAENRRE